MDQFGRPESLPSLVPFAFWSSNFVPDTVPWRKLPKSLFAELEPEVTVTAWPPLPAPETALHLELLGADWNQFAFRSSQTTYLPGSSVRVYLPSAPVCAVATAVADASPPL